MIEESWTGRWYGSPPMHGWSIVKESSRELVVYLGPNISSDAVSEIVRSHNEGIEKALWATCNYAQCS